MHKDFIYLFFEILFTYFLERGREEQREGEKHQCVVASRVPSTGDLAHNLGTCPDWESNQQPVGWQAGAQSTEPHQPGLQAKCFCFNSSGNICSNLGVQG